MRSIPEVSRRDFLRGGGAVVVSFALGGVFPSLDAIAEVGASGSGRSLDPKLVDSTLAFGADGTVTIYTSMVDVGTGLRTAMSQMAAEELGVAVGRVRVIDGDTALTPDLGGTGGSKGIPRGGVAVRQAAATARQELLRLGAARLKRPAGELVLADGMVRPAAGGAGVSIATLIGGRRLGLAVDPKAPLKPPARYTVVGKPVFRDDIPGKSTGTFRYVQDVVVPGMLHARVIRPPAMGAKLVSVEESSIQGIPGARVVRIESFLAVVADDEWAVVRAARELQAKWSDWQGLPGSEDLDGYVRHSPVDRDEVLGNRGDADAALAIATKQLSATYTWPCQSHASLGPSCSVADVRPDKATVWTSSQQPHGLRRDLAKIFGIPLGKLRLIYLDGSGSYGTNGGNDVAADALLLSKTLGKPVRVQWMRQDEHGWDPKGPPQLLDVRGGLDANGRMVAWETQMWVPGTVRGSRPLLAPDAAGLAQDHGQAPGLLSQNGEPAYAVPNLHVVVHWLKKTPLRPSNLRAPGKIANVFAVEGFIDELAAEAGADPAAFRLRGLSDPRGIEVIKRATQMIGWQARPSPNPHRTQGNLLVGRGMAYVHYKQEENYVATAMEVAVDRSSGRIAVRRVTCAHDCGLVINPNGLRNQIEGCILQTLSRSLHEEVKFDRSRVTTVDWASYPILTIPEVPRVEVALIDRPEVPPLGAGEAATSPVAAALANAVFDATGVRLRSVPFTPARIEAALTRG